MIYLDNFEVSVLGVEKEILALDSLKVELACFWNINVRISVLCSLSLFFAFFLVRIRLLLLLLVFRWRRQKTRIIVSHWDKLTALPWDISLNQQKLRSVQDGRYGRL